MVIGAHRVKIPETFFGFDGAKLGDVGLAIRRGLEAYCVQNSDVDDGRAKQIRTLGYSPPDQDSASATTRAGQSSRRSVFLVHEVLSARDEIKPRVGLGRAFAGQVPLFAVFAAAAHMAGGSHAAPFIPGKLDRAEIWVELKSVAAVTIDQCGIRTVKLQSFL